MKRSEKTKLVEEVRQKLAKSPGCFLVDYKGLNVAAISKVRRELKNADAELKVIKNTLLKIASEGTQSQVLTEMMKGPTAVTIARNDVVAVAKVLVAMAKEFQNLKLKAGQISGKLLDEEGIRRLSEVPSREVLLSKLLGTMQAVPAGFVRVLSGVLVKFLRTLEAIKQQKEQ